MYRRNTKGWLKHFDFILLDMICLQLAFVLSYWFRHGFGNPYRIALYQSMAIFLTPANISVIFFFDTMKNVIKRDANHEISVTTQHCVIVGLLAVLYLFSMQEAEAYSRITLYMMVPFYIAITYAVRTAWKKRLKKRMAGGGKKSLLVVTTQELAAGVVQNLKTHNYEMYTITGLAISDCDRIGEEIEGIAIVANRATAPLYVCREWIDEVLLIPSEQTKQTQELMDQLLETGVTVHLNLANVSDTPGKKQLVEQLGTYTVLTTSINYASTKDELIKRVLDIAGGLVGCLLTGIIFLFVAPLIYISSPGPIFFSQVRIGKNGRKFKMYKFRSMYMDAEERKQELMKQNRVTDGRMFKLDFDPRVIGNRLLPDGTQKTGIGQFIRNTSLDEFPQFFNVLKGDMSLVGTRPPTLDEWNSYQLHHRARLATKPGITGMWQISGRSKITDFEEVVKLDTQYISDWTLALDFFILLKTVKIVLLREGSM